MKAKDLVGLKVHIFGDNFYVISYGLNDSNEDCLVVKNIRTNTIHNVVGNVDVKLFVDAYQFKS